MKRVVLVHGLEGRSDLGWFKWAKEELEKRGFEVIAPDMPEADYPKIDLWVPHLSKVIPGPDKDTYFIGHSMGCQAILRYLETVDKEVGGVVLVAGFIEPGSLTGIEDEEDIEMARPWLETPIDYGKVKQVAKKIVAIFSSDDPYVPLLNATRFKDKLNANIIIKDNRGHFSQGPLGPREVPVVIEELINL